MNESSQGAKLDARPRIVLYWSSGGSERFRVGLNGDGSQLLLVATTQKPNTDKAQQENRDENL
jgi:hypothetical protein